MSKNFIALALSLASAACSGAVQRGSVTAPVDARACAGGTITSDADLSRYTSCVRIDGDLQLDGVSSLEPLANVITIDGSLQIGPTTQLSKVSGLENLKEVGELVIERNAALISLAALEGLTTAERVRIVRNPRLSKTFGFLRSFTYGSCAFELDQNAGLEAEGIRTGHELALRLLASR